MQQLTEDKLPQEVCMLLDNLVGDTAKVAVLLMMEQHLGHVIRETNSHALSFKTNGNDKGKHTILCLFSLLGIWMGDIYQISSMQG